MVLRMLSAIHCPKQMSNVRFCTSYPLMQILLDLGESLSTFILDIHHPIPCVNSCVRAFLVGITQSNISTPRAIFSLGVYAHQIPRPSGKMPQVLSCLVFLQQAHPHSILQYPAQPNFRSLKLPVAV